MVEVLAERVRAFFGQGAAAERRQFGALTFMLDGHMVCGVSAKGLMVRLDPARQSEALGLPHTSPCLGAGRPMAGFILVAPDGLILDDHLAHWLSLAAAHVATLPPKKGTP